MQGGRELLAEGWWAEPDGVGQQEKTSLEVWQGQGYRWRSIPLVPETQVTTCTPAYVMGQALRGCGSSAWHMSKGMNSE